MTDWGITIAAIIGLLIVVALAAWDYWQRWQTGDDSKRRQLIEAAVKRLVEAAEQRYKEKGSGVTKFGWVMGNLQKRFPMVAWEELAEYVEAAVLHLNRERARMLSYRNGTTPDA